MTDAVENVIGGAKLLDKGYRILYEQDVATIIDQDGNEFLQATKSVGNLFYFDEGSTMSASDHESDTNRSCGDSMSDSDESDHDVSGPTSNAHDMSGPTSNGPSPLSLRADLWHQKFGHLGHRNVELTLRRAGIHAGSGTTKCDACLTGAAKQSPFSVASSPASAPFEIISSDVCGPVTPPSLGGCRYFVVLIDHYTDMLWTKSVRRKSETEDWVKEIILKNERRTTHRVRTFRSDPGGEFVSREFTKFLRQRGIEIQRSTTATPQQNGKAERTIGTLLRTSEPCS